jgi:hypothetical protein
MKGTLLSGLLLGAVALIVAGCAVNASGGSADGAKGESVSTTSQAIQGGDVDTGDPSVGIVWRTDNRELCTGVIIGTKWVLTAAHCLNGLAGAGDVFFYTGTGSPGYTRNANTTLDYDPDADPTLTKHAVVNTFVAPGFVDGCPNKNDAALLQIGWPIYGSGISTYAPPGTAMPAVNSLVTGVGFGTHTITGIDYVGQKYTAAMNVDVVNAANIEVNELNGATGLAAKGDSGGPIYANGQIVGTLMCNIYPDVYYYQRTDQIASWISSTIQSWQDGCQTSCENAETTCGDTCECAVGYDSCLTFSCGIFTPVTFFCIHPFPSF